MKNREKELLRVLSNHVCVLTDKQIAKTWWSDTATGRSRARKALYELQDSGWLKVQRVLARSVNPAANPLYSWRPGEGSPDFHGYSRILQRRALEPAKLVTISVATEKTNNLLGIGKRSSVRLTQLTHELQVSELYLTYRRRGLTDFHWLNEGRFPKSWPVRERPDALLVDSNGILFRAIEYGGDYLPERLHALHTGLSNIGLEYEVW